MVLVQPYIIIVSVAKNTRATSVDTVIIDQNIGLRSLYSSHIFGKLNLFRAEGKFRNI